MTALLLAGVVMAAPPPVRETVDVPPAKSTVDKVADLDAGVRKVQALTAEFAKLAGPDPKNLLSRNKDEDVKDYIPRVEALIKARARLLIALREEYEKVLVARYTLECELAAYDRWIKANERNNRDFQDKYEARLKDLRDRRSKLRRTGVVVAALLRDKLQVEYDDLVAKNKNAEASSLKDTLRVLEEATVDLDRVSGRLELEKEFQGLDTAALRKQLQATRGALRDLEFEIPLAEQFAAVETSDFFGSLERQQQESIKAARALLKGLAMIEDQASEIEILSRYTSEMLAELASGATKPTIAVEIQKQLRVQPQLEKSLGVLTGARADDDRPPDNDLISLLTGKKPEPKEPAKKDPANKEPAKKP